MKRIFIRLDSLDPSKGSGTIVINFLDKVIFGTIVGLLFLFIQYSLAERSDYIERATVNSEAELRLLQVKREEITNGTTATLAALKRAAGPPPYFSEDELIELGKVIEETNLAIQVSNALNEKRNGAILESGEELYQKLEDARTLLAKASPGGPPMPENFVSSLQKLIPPIIDKFVILSSDLQNASRDLVEEEFHKIRQGRGAFGCVR